MTGPIENNNDSKTKLPEDVRDVLHTAAAQSDNPTQLYIILWHYSMNVKGTKDALFWMNMENEKMVNESKLESHIQFDIVLACFLDDPSPIADFPL